MLKAKRILGLLYRKYCNHVWGDACLQPHLPSKVLHYRGSQGCHEGNLSDHTWNMVVLSGIPTHWRTRGTLSRSKSLHVRWYQYAGMLDMRIYWSWWVYLHLNRGGFIWNYVYYTKLLMACVTSPLGFLLPGKFLTTLGWIPFNCISHLHELKLFSSLSFLTPFPYGTHYTLNRLLVHIQS